MRRASPHVSVAVLATVGALTLAGAASAQTARESAEARGLRYLSWQGRAAPAEPAGRDAAGPAPVRMAPRRPNTVIPHGGVDQGGTSAPARPTAAPARRTLTPANAWLRPAAPLSEPAPVPPPAPAPPPATPPTAPDYLPDQGGRSQPAPAAIVYPTPAAAVTAGAVPADPMAPRRDAPIFHLQRDTAPPSAAQSPEVAGSAPAPSAAPPSDDATRQGARYYSVHRQNGREPDPLAIPPPNYVDALVVSSIETLASQDLAVPAQGPTLIRDRNGNVRAAPAASEGDHQ